MRRSYFGPEVFLIVTVMIFFIIAFTILKVLPVHYIHESVPIEQGTPVL